METVHGIKVAKKRNTKSKAWIYFGLRVTDDGEVIEEHQQQPICRKCGTVVRAKEGNTSNLFQHLRDHHPELLTNIVSGSSSSTMTQRTIKESIARSTKLPHNSPQAKEITCAITYHLAKDAVPLCTVEKPGFKELVSKLNPRYERKFFSQQEIPGLYFDVRCGVLAELKQAKYYSITTDLWTSGACEPYITLTVHYIDGDWCLKTKCLDTVALFADHTGDNIAQSVIDILSNWEFETKKIVAATTDSGSNVVKAFRILDKLFWA